MKGRKLRNKFVNAWNDDPEWQFVEVWKKQSLVEKKQAINENLYKSMEWLERELGAKGAKKHAEAMKAQGRAKKHETAGIWMYEYNEEKTVHMVENKKEKTAQTKSRTLTAGRQEQEGRVLALEDGVPQTPQLKRGRAVECLDAEQDKFSGKSVSSTNDEEDMEEEQMEHDTCVAGETQQDGDNADEGQQAVAEEPEKEQGTATPTDASDTKPGSAAETTEPDKQKTAPDQQETPKAGRKKHVKEKVRTIGEAIGDTTLAVCVSKMDTGKLAKLQELIQVLLHPEKQQ